MLIGVSAAAHASRDPNDTDFALGAARGIVSTASTPEAKLQAELRLARMLTRRADDHPDEGTEAEALYRQILSRNLTEEVRLRCFNDYGVLLLDRGDFAGAHDAFQQVRSLIASPRLRVVRIDRAHYLFNIATSDEKSGAFDDAVKGFEQSLEGMDSDESCDALADIGGRIVTTSMVDVVARRVRNHDTVCAAAILGNALRSQEWQSRSDDYLHLLTTWAEYLAVSRTTLGTFKRRWESITYQGPSSLARQKFGALTAAYATTPLPVTLDSAAAEQVARGWAADARDRRALSEVLVLTLDELAPGASEEVALPRALLAWNIDRTSVNAAIALASTLSAMPPVLDKFRAVVLDLGKSSKGGVSEAGAPAAVRLQVTLADLFAAQEQWDEAIEHGQLALAAWERLPQDERQKLPVAEMHAKLGRAYAHAGCGAEATAHNLKGAESYVAHSRPEIAEPLVHALELASEPLDAGAGKRLEAIVKAIELSQLPRESSIDSAGDAIKYWIITDPELTEAKLSITVAGGIIHIGGTVASPRQAGYLAAVVAPWRDASGVIVEVTNR